MTQDLKIIQKIYDMIQYGYIALRQFPKSEKFALVADIKQCMHNVLARAVEGQKKYFKKTTLQDMDVELTKLKAFTRLAQDLGFLPKKKYEVWAKMNVELGRMLGGWIKSTQQPKQ